MHNFQSQLPYPQHDQQHFQQQYNHQGTQFASSALPPPPVNFTSIFLLITFMQELVFVFSDIL
jgi:hypothetical protein